MAEESKCVICYEGEDQVKCTRCEGWVCLDCNGELDICPFCREPWGPAAPQLAQLGPLDEGLMEQGDADQVLAVGAVALPPPLEAPAAIAQHFHLNQGAVGFEDAGWWFEEMPYNDIVQMPWNAFEEYAGFYADAEWRLTHQVWARKLSYHVDANFRIELIAVKLFHNGHLEHEWDIERVVYE